MRFRTSGIVVALLLAAGCAAAPPQGTAAPPAAVPGFPVTIEHALGTTRIPAPPTRIVALSFEEDVLSQVGVATVGHADNAYARPYPWQEGTVDLAGSTPLAASDGLALEQVATLEPDLVLPRTTTASARCTRS